LGFHSGRVAVWLLATLLGIALVVVLALAQALRKATRWSARTDREVATARVSIEAAVAEATRAHLGEIRRTLARETSCVNPVL
jgi:hypothetical protein